MLSELALFAGAGGGILGTQLLGARTVCAVERNGYVARVLAQRQNDGCLPCFPIWDDVKTFDARSWRGRIDIVSGGFPCQAFSTAARGRNNAEDLWPHMCRIVAEVSAPLVFAENVAKRAIKTASDDLRALGYATVAVPLAAKDVGADHIRQRYWLLAHSDCGRELLHGLYAKTPLGEKLHPRVWSSYAAEPRMADGVANRVDRLAATGNGQVPAVAAAAFSALAEIALSGTE